jgi:hypothetical protein
MVKQFVELTSAFPITVPHALLVAADEVINKRPRLMRRGGALWTRLKCLNACASSGWQDSNRMRNVA